MSDIRPFPGSRDPEPSKPNEALVGAIRHLLALAESGQLRSFIGTGWTGDGLRVCTWADHHDNIYQMLGSLEWLKQEYIERHPRTPQ